MYLKDSYCLFFPRERTIDRLFRKRVADGEGGCLCADFEPASSAYSMPDTTLRTHANSSSFPTPSSSRLLRFLRPR